MDQSITVKVKSSSTDGEFKEFEFPQLKKYLDEGYHIANIHQLISSTQHGVCMFVTFHLRK